MRRMTFRGGVGFALLALLGALALLVPSGAAAQNGEEAVQPAPGYEEFEGCPVVEPTGIPICLNITATGDLNLGDVDASIDEPLEIQIAIMASLGGEAEIYLAEGDGSDPVRVPGGLLGIPELDPVADLLADELGLNVLTIDAQPNLGEPVAEIEETVLWLVIGIAFSGVEEGEVVTGEEFLDIWEMMGEGPFPAQQLGLPLDIELHNMLFGTSCGIGSADNPIEINATTGETSPPEGTDPIEGALGDSWYEMPDDLDTPFPNPLDHSIRRWHGNQYVDNGFAVPGPKGCNTLAGLGYEGTAVESLVNLDSLIGSQTGLPSDAGNNQAAFQFDFDMALYYGVYPDL